MSCNQSDNVVSPQSENTKATDNHITDPNSPDNQLGFIYAITGKKGFNNGSKSWDNYAGYFVGQSTGTVYYDTIVGNGLGSFGTITLDIPNNSGYSPSYDFAFQSISWTDTKIVFRINTTSTYVFPETGRLKVNSNTGVSYFQNMSIVPYIYDKQYGQADWWVMKRTVENNLPHSNAEYHNIQGDIDPVDFTPTEHDLLSWGDGVHMAYIESVNSLYSSGNVITYYIDISESNVTYTRSYKTIIVKIHNNGGNQRFFVQGYDRYYSAYNSGNSSAVYCKVQ